MEQAADRLLELIDEWLEEAGECSSNLKALARELMSLRENCNAVETVGSTVAVAGSLLAIGGAFFTGGASLALLGAVGGVGAGVSVVTKITEQFMTSSKLNSVKKIDKNCNEISEKIQSLFNQLRDECPSSETTQKDQYAVNEILKAISRRSGIGCFTYVTDFHDVVHGLVENDLVKAISKGLAVSLMGEFLSAFSLLSAAASKGGERVGKAVAIRGASRFLGGVVGLAFSLPEAIDNWTEAIKNKHETQASKSLRDTAEKIDDTRRNLTDKLSQIQ
ncbi:uncharacterized protein LOC117389423 isoform X2 [Periophthalmus magnuspinnatus]|nr:uncharacterized protein LOC117389423 isoform X2 [Periophthalmus magnuspinnatus]